ncbi:MAG: hypothetical protein SOV85_03430 [Clostridium sp.]|nr:hypothetical protein [Clostridium sp.]MDY2630398.1 hypothetical protein [Clostridium sp.]
MFPFLDNETSFDGCTTKFSAACTLVAFKGKPTVNPMQIDSSVAKPL